MGVVSSEEELFDPDKLLLHFKIASGGDGYEGSFYEAKKQSSLGKP